MKKFAFSLQRMLAYKESLYEKERNELARLRRERLEIEQRKLGVQRQMAQMDAEYREEAATTGVSAEEIAKINYHRTNSRFLEEQLDKDMAAKDVQIEKQLEIVLQLDQDVKGLEKLKEKKWEEYQEAAAGEERERILEMVSTKFIETKAEEAAEEARAAAVS